MVNENERINGLNSEPCESSYDEKRRGIERRTNNKSRIKYLLFNGRRERSRRTEDNAKAIILVGWPDISSNKSVDRDEEFYLIKEGDSWKIRESVSLEK